jgi:hypothetical protein
MAESEIPVVARHRRTTKGAETESVVELLDGGIHESAIERHPAGRLRRFRPACHTGRARILRRLFLSVLGLRDIASGAINYSRHDIRFGHVERMTSLRVCDAGVDAIRHAHQHSLVESFVLGGNHCPARLGPPSRLSHLGLEDGHVDWHLRVTHESDIGVIGVMGESSLELLWTQVAEPTPVNIDLRHREPVPTRKPGPPLWDGLQLP